MSANRRLIRAKRMIALPRRQRGVVLLVIMLVTLTVGGYFGVRALNVAFARSGMEDLEAEQILAKAKAALLAWSLITVDNPLSNGYPMNATTPVGLRAFRPGNLPYPDLAAGFTNTTPSDGVRDNGCASLTWAGSGTLRLVDSALASNSNLVRNRRINLRCFGRLPLITLGLDSAGLNTNDTSGRWPWYAVSANLVSTGDVCPVRLDGSISNSALPDGSNNCGDALTTSAPFPWIVVQDPYGNIISSRVAAVIILPGPVTTRQPGSVRQVRSATALPATFLDTVDNVACPGGRCDNSMLPSSLPNTTPMTFIQCVKASSVVGDARFSTNYSCNDRLTYITVDELFNHAAKRLEREFVNCLEEYANNSSPIRVSQLFPWAALTSPSDVSPNQYSGMFPSKGVSGEPTPLTPCPNAQNGSASAYLQGWQFEATYTLGDGTPTGGRKSATFQFANLIDPRTGKPRTAITVSRL